MLEIRVVAFDGAKAVVALQARAGGRQRMHVAIDADHLRTSGEQRLAVTSTAQCPVDDHLARPRLQQLEGFLEENGLVRKRQMSARQRKHRAVSEQRASLLQAGADLEF